ncbi:porin, partial [Paraburkholderia sp. SIMBA_049]
METNAMNTKTRNGLLAAGACCALAAPGAHAQSSVTLYGVIDTSIAWVHGNDGQANNSWQMLSGNLQGSRWGLKGA